MQYRLYLMMAILLMYHQMPKALARHRIISYELWKTVSKDDLKLRMKDRKVPKAMLDPKFDVDIYDVIYRAYWHDGTEREVSGLYFVPKGAHKALPKLVYHHGTRFTKGRASEIERETNFALGYAVDGYIVLMPDYFGLGHSSDVHIYQQYRPLGQTTVDFLLAVRELDETFQLYDNTQLFLTGYSLGGYAALAANKLIQEQYADQFHVTATSANAGAYDMAGAQRKSFFQPYVRPQFLPYFLIGVNEVYNIFSNLNDIYLPPYDSVVQKYFDGYHSHEGLESLLPKIPIRMLQDSIVQIFLKDENYILHRVIKENSLVDWKPDNPVQLCHCKRDEVVFYENAEAAYAGMKKAGAEDVTIRNPGKKYTHRGCALLATSYSKLYFDSFREEAKYGRKGSLAQRFFLSLAKMKKPVLN